MIDKAGVVHLIGHGRINDAGLGDGDVLDAVAAETTLPAPRRLDTDGNAHPPTTRPGWTPWSVPAGPWPA